MSLKFTKVKAHLTVQDFGRWGFQSNGVPVSGPMDGLSFRNANLIVGNDINTSCLEIGMGTIDMIVTGTTLISLCGNGHKLIINDTKAESNRPTLISRECTIRLKPGDSGMWSYLAVAGGFEISEILGSQSTYLTSGFGGFHGRAIKKSDELVTKSKHSAVSSTIIKSLAHASDDFVCAKWSVSNVNTSFNKIRITPGPEWDWLSEAQQKNFIHELYAISNDSNRMGYRLNGKPIDRQSKEEMISSGVTKGTIQLTNDGSLIVLMADSQTVGGYPRIAQVTSVDIPLIAQKVPGTKIQFELISHDEAEGLLLNQEMDLRKLKAGIRMKMYDIR